jgi:hypothetical protein
MHWTAPRNSDKNYPQQIYQKKEGATFYWWCRVHFHLPLCTLLALSIVWPFLPDALFASDLIHGIDIWFRAHFEKLAAEGAAYDGMEPLWGTRYVSFLAICWSFVVLTNVILAGPIINLTWKFGHPLSYDQRNGIWKSPVSLAIVGYFTFGQWMDLQNANPGHYAIFLTRSWIIYPFAAGLAALIHMSFAVLIISIVKILKYRTK